MQLSRCWSHTGFVARAQVVSARRSGEQKIASTDMGSRHLRTPASSAGAVLMSGLDPRATACMRVLIPYCAQQPIVRNDGSRHAKIVYAEVKKSLD